MNITNIKYIVWTTLNNWHSLWENATRLWTLLNARIAFHMIWHNAIKSTLTSDYVLITFTQHTCNWCHY
mgnify:CR=1 FL=1